jgi:hypothetical protein
VVSKAASKAVAVNKAGRIVRFESVPKGKSPGALAGGFSLHHFSSLNVSASIRIEETRGRESLSLLGPLSAKETGLSRDTDTGPQRSFTQLG